VVLCVLRYKRGKEESEPQPNLEMAVASDTQDSPYEGLPMKPQQRESKVKGYEVMPSEIVVKPRDKDYGGMPTQEEIRKVSDPPPRSATINANPEWWKINFDDITLGAKIGSGGYGFVHKAKWHDQTVAVKMLHDDSDKVGLDEFQKEADLMIHLKAHQNVLKLIGVAKDPSRPMAIVTEYLELGSLRKLLDDPKIEINFTQVIRIAKDIARGVQHLHAEKIYHRDLSARNILVTENKKGWICKVADFGLSRFADSHEATTKSDTGPLKWMAPESLLEKKYSAKSDAWSYGVTLYEILSRKEPYADLDNIQAASNVMHKGLKLKSPEHCPPKLAELMKSCFETDAENRPNFKKILSVLGEIEDDVKANPFY